MCGASQGIGEATARELAQLGARVCLLARSKDRLAQITTSLPGEGHRYLDLDLSDRDQLEKRVQAEIEKSGPIHILINNTSGPKSGPVAEARDDEFLMGFANHVLVASRLAQLLLPGMKSARYGRIINILSTSVKAPIPNLGVSNTIRAAMANWSKTLSLEVASFGITVNNVLPGYTETPRLESLIEGAAQRLGVSAEKVAEDWRANIPAKRFAKPQEIAQAIAFLASPAAGYVNGINLPVDGGRTGSL